MTDPTDLSSAIDALSGANVMVIGDLMLDRFVYGEVERISPEAPVPVIRVGAEESMLGGAGNVAQVRRSLHEALRRRGIEAETFDPWYFPDPEAYGARLEAAGFRVDSIDLINRPTPIPGSLADWLDVFARSFLAAVDVGEHAALKAEVENAVAADLCDADGNWTVDYVRLRFKAVKAGG